MKIFFDTEFMEDGRTIELLSLGAVREDGHEFYALNSRADRERANPWVREHVLPCLEMIPEPRRFNSEYATYLTPEQLAESFRRFVAPAGEYPALEFWSYYGAYDWVAVCQLYGPMIMIPATWPKFTYDLRTYLNLGGFKLVAQPDDHPHHALLDARWIAETYRQYELPTYAGGT